MEIVLALVFAAVATLVFGAAHLVKDQSGVKRRLAS